MTNFIDTILNIFRTEVDPAHMRVSEPIYRETDVRYWERRNSEIFR